MHGKSAVTVFIPVSSVNWRAASVVLFELVGAANHAFGDEIDDLADAEHDAQR